MQRLQKCRGVLLGLILWGSESRMEPFLILSLRPLCRKTCELIQEPSLPTYRKQKLASTRALSTKSESPCTWNIHQPFPGHFMATYFPSSASMTLDKFQLLQKSKSKLGFYVLFNSQGHIGTGPQNCHLWDSNPHRWQPMIRCQTAAEDTYLFPLWCSGSLNIHLYIHQ